MNSEDIDLVIVKPMNTEESPFNCGMVFQAPAWSRLKKGDTVLVEGDEEMLECKVESCITISRKAEEMEFIFKATGSKNPLRKVLYKISYRDLWEES